MASIQELYQTIKKIDTAKSPFEGVSYDLTYNDKLGLPDGDPNASPDEGNFTVLAPFPAIPKDIEARRQLDAGKTPIEQAFKAVVREGVKLSKDQDTLFIDLTDLDANNVDLFTEGGKDSVAQAIANAVNDPSLANVKPVIRFVRGTPDETIDAEFWNSRRPNLEKIFWQPDDQGNTVPLITHDKAELHIGFYSPSFRLP